MPRNVTTRGCATRRTFKVELLSSRREESGMEESGTKRSEQRDNSKAADTHFAQRERDREKERERKT